jgi:hypothetical protein
MIAPRSVAFERIAAPTSSTFDDSRCLSFHTFGFPLGIFERVQGKHDSTIGTMTCAVLAFGEFLSVTAISVIACNIVNANDKYKNALRVLICLFPLPPSSGKYSVSFNPPQNFNLHLEILIETYQHGRR